MSQQQDAANGGPEALKLTAMHHEHIRLGATMENIGGWLRPVVYRSVEEETEAVKSAVGICDISPTGKLLVQGPGAEDLARKLLGGSAAMQTGKAQPGSLNAADGAAHPALVCCLASEDLFVTCPPEHRDGLAEALKVELSNRSDDPTIVLDVTSAYAAINIAGPRSPDLLCKATDMDLQPDVMSDLSCIQGQVAEVYGALVRWDQGHGPGYNLYVAREYGVYVWEVLWEAGDEFDVAPVGVAARRKLVGGVLP